MNQPEQTNLIQQRPKSTFVSIVAIIFIVLAGIKSFNSTIGTISYFVVFSHSFSEITKTAYSTDSPFRMIAPLLANAWILFISDWLLSVATLVASIWTYKRKNWARLMFVSLLVFSIFSLLAFPIIFHIFMSRQREYSMTDFHQRYVTIQIITVTIVTLLTFLFGWIIKKLSSDDIKKEFISNLLAG